MRRRAVAALALYYAITGAWPLVHLPSFEAVTGPKTDRWLVKMVGALAVANGAALAFGLRRPRVAPETVALGVASAAAFCAIDVTYVARGRIRPVYLGDAAVEAVLAALLLGPDAAPNESEERRGRDAN
jgi:hypothetical protein